jgi:hypothetical protein
MSDEATKTFDEKISKLGDELAGLTLKEAVDLGDYMKETYGIEAAAGGAVMMAGPGGGDDAGGAAEKTSFDVVIWVSRKPRRSQKKLAARSRRASRRTKQRTSSPSSKRPAPRSNSPDAFPLLSVERSEGYKTFRSLRRDAEQPFGSGAWFGAKARWDTVSVKVRSAIAPGILFGYRSVGGDSSRSRTRWLVLLEGRLGELASTDLC